CRDLVPKQLAACCQTAVSRSRVRRDVAVGKQQRLHCPATLVHQTPRSPPNITCRDRIERNIEHCFVSVNGLARLPSLGVAPRDLNSPSRAATVVGTELRRQKMAFAMLTCAIEYPQGPQSCEAVKGFLLERVVNVGVPAEDLARPFGRQDDDDGATWRRNCH